MTAMSHAVVFWPIDIKQSGFCYGWLKPVLCVAGVFNADSRIQAQAQLQSLQASEHQFALACGSDPRILGRCTFDGPAPSLALDHRAKGTYTFMYYYRHGVSSMRFYSLGVVTSGDMRLAATQRPALRDDFTLQQSHLLTPGLNLTVINQLNAAKAIEGVLQEKRKPVSKAGVFRLPSTFLSVGLFIMNLAMSMAAAIQIVCCLLSHFCDISIKTPVLQSTCLKDLSAILKQLDIRSKQIIFFVDQMDKLWQQSHICLLTHSGPYVNFYNSLWLVLNDIILGVAFGTFLCENHITLGIMLNFIVRHWLVDWVQQALLWLDKWPAGLKLNTELSRFYSHTFIDLVAIWGVVLLWVSPHLSSIIFLIGIVSHCGITLAISHLCELLGVFTAHISVCYFISMVVYQGLLRTVRSLWNLFCGKRFNVLRNRIDSWNYDVDQLLFGTILFTLAAYLFPTVLAYYSLFVMLRLITVFFQASMEILLAGMNNFPLFMLTLYVKDSWRLPDGVNFISSFAFSQKPYLLIKNQSCTLSSLFSQYCQLWSSFSSHYHPAHLILCILLGQYVGV